ncbi:hypothetical protein E4T38_02955 [Aureobasidium subglaciale]|nr:hypothetical protein E4T38_02955 [Aureobasidium subglaciale]KAI5227260.1 hypothetical protein E4T40_02608 [Aureobasidium subglaciale]KAI5230583.1 hypothetical protein E4T41_02954 [Aureobasidium subglaciale]KAI5264931.1 hypothetical protein E4T46_02732 [Aureobasidium subglaciale]
MTSSGRPIIYHSKLRRMPDFENYLILITCASGKQSAALIPHILNMYKNIRLQCNSSASKQEPTDYETWVKMKVEEIKSKQA